MNEWIDWTGADAHRRPRGPDKGEIITHVRFRNGDEHRHNSHFEWCHFGVEGDIVAYLLAQEQA